MNFSTFFVLKSKNTIENWIIALIFFAGMLLFAEAGQAQFVKYTLTSSFTPSICGVTSATTPASGSGVQNISTSPNATSGYSGTNFPISGTAPTTTTALSTTTFPSYFQLSFTNSTGSTITLTSESMTGYYGGSGATISDDFGWFYSTNAFATSCTKLATNVAVSANSTASSNLTTSIAVATGTTLTIRVFHYNTDATTATCGVTLLTLTAATPAVPAAFSAAGGNAQNVLSSTANAASNNVLLAWNTTNTFGTPTAGTVYSSGNSISGGGTVLYNAVAGSNFYTHSSLTNGTTYYYSLWSVGASSCAYSTALTANAIPVAPCATPSVPASITGGTTTTTTIPGTITSSGTAPTGYIVISSTNATLSAGPANGTPYTAGTALGGGTVQYMGRSTSFTASNSLSSNTKYYLFAYSYDSLCSGQPYYSTTSASTNATTIPVAPTIGTATAGNTQATVAFTAPSGSATITNYTATSTPAGGTSTPTTTSPITITGLTNGIAYTFKVTATNVGGTSAASTASNSVTPVAPCVTPTVPSAVSSGTTTTTTIPGTIIAPGTAPTGYIVISSTSSSLTSGPVNGTSYTAGTALGGGKVQYMGRSTSFTASSSLSSNTQYYLFAYSYDSLCSGQPYYSSTAVNSNSYTCIAAPTALTASSITTSAAIVSWTAPSGSVSSYTLEYEPSGGSFTTVTGITGTSYNLSGLSSGTAYIFQVLAINTANTSSCGTSSAYSSTGNFTTTCGTVTLPYSQNFDGVTAPAIPNCWTILNPGTGNAWATVAGSAGGNDYATGFSSPNVLEYAYNENAAANTWAITPGLSLTAGTTYALSYNYAADYNSTSYSENLSIYYGTSPTTAALTTQLLPVTAYTDGMTAFASNTINFVAPSTGTFYIGFHCTSGTNEGYLDIDDLSVVALPACTTPSAATGLSLSANSGTSLTSTFTAPSPAPTNYLVIRTTTSTAPTAPSNGTSYTVGATALGGTIISENTTTGFTDNTVTANTQYWYWIYSYNAGTCGGGPLYSSSNLNGNITMPTQKLWIGAGSSSTATGTDFNAAANWSPAVSPAAGDNLVMNLVYSGTAPVIAPASGSTSISINSLTITYSGAFTAAKAASLTIPNTYSLTTAGNVSLSNSGSTNISTLNLVIASGGTLAIGGNLTLINTGAKADVTTIANSGTMSVTGTTVANNENSGANGTVNIEVATGATTTFSGAVTLDQGSSASNVSLAPVYLTGTASGSTGKFIFGGNLTLGAYAYTNANSESLVTIFDASGSQTITDNLYYQSNNDNVSPYAWSPGTIQIGNVNNPTVTINASNSNYGIINDGQSNQIEPYSNLTINGSSTLILPSSESLDNAYYNINDATNGTLTMSGTATVQLGGSDDAVGTGSNLPSGFATYTFAAGSTVEYDGISAQTIYKIPVYGNLTIGDAVTTPASSATAGGALTVAGNLTINTGATFSGSSYTHSIKGNWVNNGTFAASSGTITFSGAAAQSINSGGSAFNKISITNTSGGVSLLTNNLTVGSTFTLNGAGGFNTNGLTNTITGLTTLTSGTYTASTAAQAFNGGLTVSGGTFTAASNSVVSAAAVTLSSGTLTAPGASGSFTVTGNWALTSGSTFTPNGGTVTFNGTTTISGTGTSSFYGVTINNAHTLTGPLSANMNLSGNWANNGTFTANSGTVTFNGSSAQTITGATTFYSLTLNNSTGATLGSAETVGGVLTLTNGILTTTSSNLLSITNTATTAVSGGSTTTFVNGPLSWTFPSSLSNSTNVYKYPLGAGTTYLPFSITSLTTGIAPALAVQAFIGSSGGTGDGVTLGTAGLSNSEYWSSILSGGTLTNASVSLTRQTAVGPLYVISESSTQGGAYKSYGGTPSGTSINNSTNIANTATQYYVMAQTPAIVIAAALSPTSETTCSGAASSDMTLSVSGTNMISGITVTPPPGFEVSLTASSGFANSVVVGSAGTIASTPVYIRLAAADAASTYSGNIVLSTTGASSVNTAITTSTVNPLPSALILTGSTVCSGVTTTIISSTSVSGINYQLYNSSAVAQGSALSGTGSSLTWSSIAAGSGYYVIGTNITTGCISAQSNAVNVVINVLPAANISYNGSPYCGTGTASVTQSGQAGGTYTSTTGLSINSSTGAINLISSTPGTYTVTYSFTNGTCSNTATTNVTINAQPTATISYSGSPYCATGTANVTQSGQTGGIYSSSTGLSINSGTGAIDLVASTAGTYTVTYSFSSGSCSNSTTTGITINAAPTNSNAGSNQGICSTTGSVTLSANTPTIGTGLWTVTSGPNTSSSQFSSTTDAAATFTPAGGAGNYVLAWTISSSSPCSSSSSTVTITVNSSNSWTGAASNTDWNDANNWSCGIVPNGSTADVTIVSSPYPVLTSNITIHNLTVQGASTVSINGNTLTVNGSITGTGTLSGTSASNLTIGGTAGTLNFTSGFASLGSLTVTSGSATLGTGLAIYNNLDVAGGTLNLNSQNVSLKSGSGGTASVNTITGTLSGATNVTVERYIPSDATRAWRLLSVPTSGSQTINAAWQEGQTHETDNTPGYGTIITANASNTNWAADGYDTVQVDASIITYSPGSNSWSLVPSTYNSIATTSGYFLYIRGDRSELPSGTSGPTNATTLRTTGGLYQGPITSSTIAAGQFGLLGNPYVSSIDFTRLTLNGGVNSTFYLWDPKIKSGNSLGVYQTFNSATGYATPISGGSYGSSNTRIESGAAFFVYAPSASGSVGFSESSKTGDTTANQFRPAGVLSTNSVLQTNLFSTVSGAQVDGNFAVFNSAYSNGLNGSDALKLANNGENLAILLDSTKLAVEARQPVTGTDTIFYDMWNMQQQQYKLQFIPTNLNTGGLTAYLQDAYLGTSTPLNLSATSTVAFSVDGNAASSASNRFRVVFNNNSSPVPVTFIAITAQQKSSSSINVSWEVGVESGVAYYEVEHSTDGKNFTAIGQLTPKSNAVGTAAYNWLDDKAVQGVNYYRVMSVGAAGDIKYTEVVKVVIGAAAPAIAIYPNPVVKGGYVSIELSDQPAGVYGVRVLNTAGQEMYATTINHGGGSSVHGLVIPAVLAGGLYKLEVTSPGAAKYTLNMVIQ